MDTHAHFVMIQSGPIIWPSFPSMRNSGTPHGEPLVKPRRQVVGPIPRQPLAAEPVPLPAWPGTNEPSMLPLKSPSTSNWHPWSTTEARMLQVSSGSEVLFRGYTCQRFTEWPWRKPPRDKGLTLDAYFRS